MALGKKTGGRTKGVPNKATGEVKALAMSYVPAAIRELARLAKKAKSEQARVAACNAILDRAVGKPAQAIDLSNQDGSLASMFAAAVHAANGITMEAPDTTGGESIQH